VIVGFSPHSPFIFLLALARTLITTDHLTKKIRRRWEPMASAGVSEEDFSDLFQQRRSR
jgi:hypothetical protein